MPDVMTHDARSRNMAKIRSKDTKPELILRSGLHRAGYRFKLHDRSLPGSPDMVFPRRRAVIFAHGCFWHGHNCHLFHWPQTREEFWFAKINRNKERDVHTFTRLQAAGWRQGVVWECALKGRQRFSTEHVIALCVAWLESECLELDIAGHCATLNEL